MSVNEIKSNNQPKITSDSDLEESQQDKDRKLSRAEEIITSSSQGKKKDHAQKGLVKDIILGNSGDSNNRVKSEASLLDAVKMERADRALKQSQKSDEKVNHSNQQPSVIQMVLGGANSTGPSPAITTSNPELDGKLDRADKYLSVGSTAPRSHSSKHNIKAALLSPSPNDQGSDPELGDRLSRAENILKKSHTDLSPSASKSGKHGFGIMAHILGDNKNTPSNLENTEMDSKLQRAENALNSDSLRAPGIALNRSRSSSYQNIKNSLFGTSANSSEDASRHQMQYSFEAEMKEKLERADHAIQTSNLIKRSHNTSNQNIKAALLGGGSESQSHTTETQPEVEEKMNRADGILKKDSSLVSKSSQKTTPGIKASIIGAGAGEKKEPSSTDPNLQKKIDRAEKSLKVSDKAAVSAAPSVKGMSIKSSLMGSSPPPTKTAGSESTSKSNDTDKIDKAARAEKVIADSKSKIKAAPKNEKGMKNNVVTGIMGSMSNILSPAQGKAKGSSKDKLGGTDS